MIALRSRHGPILCVVALGAYGRGRVAGALRRALEGTPIMSQDQKIIRACGRASHLNDGRRQCAAYDAGVAATRSRADLEEPHAAVEIIVTWQQPSGESVSSPSIRSRWLASATPRGSGRAGAQARRDAARARMQGAHLRHGPTSIRPAGMSCHARDRGNIPASRDARAIARKILP